MKAKGREEVEEEVKGEREEGRETRKREERNRNR